jgi:presqualene diphosphate synthase
VSAQAQTTAAEHKASGSSFYTAMRLMPKAQRQAMYAIYAFCRAVDDIADDAAAPRVIRAAGLDKWRNDIEALYANGRAGNAAFLVDVVQTYGLRKNDLLAVIDGMAMDVASDICAPELATLDLYCDRVASAVGRLSIKVFGMEEESGDALAHHLGRALQLTNIVRDLDEDAAVGRLYLPREFLDEAGIQARDPSRALDDPRVDLAARNVAKRAHAHYAESMHILNGRPTGQLRAPRLMAAVYAQILSKMEAQGWRPPRTRVRLSKPELLYILLRHGLM